MFIHQMFISMVFRSNVHFYKRRKYRDLKGLSDIFVNFIVNDKNNYYLLWIVETFFDLQCYCTCMNIIYMYSIKVKFIASE